MTFADHLIYALLWLFFGAAHSVLASETAKHLTRAWFGRQERLAYNLVAVLHFAATVAAGQFLLGGSAAVPFNMPPLVQGALGAALVAGAILILVALRHYDLGRFAGTTPDRHGAAPEPLHTGGLHRWVRHPLYSGAFLLLLGGATDAFGLATCLWASLYLLIGTWFEEQRLIRLYGDAYRRYRATVPAFIPWRGRAR
ncbi:MAG: isoprenylcysteine carboxylmethyltransferase family protein [Minwuia sp.]|nr:isoprenylcysteine carboxylmethyltransferase family protein [Minwuia sp.]